MFKTSWSSTKSPQFTKESGNAQKEGNSKLDLDTVNDTFLSGPCLQGNGLPFSPHVSSTQSYKGHQIISETYNNALLPLPT